MAHENELNASDVVIGEGELRGDFINDDTLTQERILTAAITPRQRAA